jgi:sodium/potassium/calcium exchanger 6
MLSSHVILLQAIGRITEIPNGVMGLTVLAWGNSIGDLFSNISVAKTGRADMAIAGCYGGPLFNLLIGLGISLVLQCTKTSGAGATHTTSGGTAGTAATTLPAGSVAFGMDTYSKISMCFLLVALAVTALVVKASGFGFRRRYGFVLIFWYGVYCMVNLAQLKYGMFGP